MPHTSPNVRDLVPLVGEVADAYGVTRDRLKDILERLEDSARKQEISELDVTLSHIRKEVLEHGRKLATVIESVRASGIMERSPGDPSLRDALKNCRDLLSECDDLSRSLEEQLTHLKNETQKDLLEQRGHSTAHRSYASTLRPAGGGSLDFKN